MRRLLTLECEGVTLGATLDEAAGDTCLLMVSGGSQTRIGSHRMYERLSRSLVQHGFPSLRFDRRGVGDSDGEDPGFRDCGPDLEAAAALVRSRAGRGRVIGLGLCDGASALALFAERIGLDGLILINPWMVEAQAGEPPPAAIRRRYRDRLTSLSGWKDLLSGQVDYRKLLRGLVKIADRTPAGLSTELAFALRAASRPTAMILATGDATAIAAEAEAGAPAFAQLIGCIVRVESDSHTFAGPGDEDALEAAVLHCLEWMKD